MVARIVEQLGGQLRVDSKVGIGSRFSFLIPFSTEFDGSTSSISGSQSQSTSLSRTGSQSNREDEIDNLVQAISQTHLVGSPHQKRLGQSHESGSSEFFEVENTDIPPPKSALGLTTDPMTTHDDIAPKLSQRPSSSRKHSENSGAVRLRILIVEVSRLLGHLSTGQFSPFCHTRTTISTGQS